MAFCAAGWAHWAWKYGQIDLICEYKYHTRTRRLSFLIKACLVLITINATSVYGKRHKKGKKIHNQHQLDAGDDYYADEEPHARVPQIDFHGGLRKGMAMQVGLIDPNKNAICSPISALLPLAKITLGARGRTYTELLNALGYTSEELKPSLIKLINSLKYIEGITLDVVSKIFMPERVSLNAQFEEKSRDIFGSSVDKVPFGNRKRLVDTINDFVARETRNMIKKLLSESDIPPHAILVLVNVIYFQGNWKKRFDKAKPSKFYTAEGAQIVPMMEVIDRFKYVKADSINAEIIEIPYMKRNASFVVVLPDDRKGLPMLLTALKLAPALLNDAMKGMKETSVKVLLPKFKTTTKLNLKDMYQKCGVVRIFNDNHRELDGIAGGEAVTVSSAIQKAVIEVSELGTEAAAATGVDLMPVSLLLADVHFKADHPFLYFVMANEQQLFAGIYSKP